MSNVEARDAQKISERYTGKKCNLIFQDFYLIITDKALNELAFPPLSKAHDVLVTS